MFLMMAPIDSRLYHHLTIGAVEDRPASTVEHVDVHLALSAAILEARRHHPVFDRFASLATAAGFAALAAWMLLIRPWETPT